MVFDQFLSMIGQPIRNDNDRKPTLTWVINKLFSMKQRLIHFIFNCLEGGFNFIKGNFSSIYQARKGWSWIIASLMLNIQFPCASQVFYRKIFFNNTRWHDLGCLRVLSHGQVYHLNFFLCGLRLRGLIEGGRGIFIFIRTKSPIARFYWSYSIFYWLSFFSRIFLIELKSQILQEVRILLKTLKYCNLLESEKFSRGGKKNAYFKCVFICPENSLNWPELELLISFWFRLGLSRGTKKVELKLIELGNKCAILNMVKGSPESGLQTQAISFFEINVGKGRINDVIFNWSWDDSEISYSSKSRVVLFHIRLFPMKISKWDGLYYP